MSADSADNPKLSATELLKHVDEVRGSVGGE